jgi:hypothetical protein
MRASATKRTSAGLRDIEVSLSRRPPSNNYVGRAFPRVQTACVQAVCFSRLSLPSVLPWSRRRRANQA